jgi:hypothetical protein
VPADCRKLAPQTETKPKLVSHPGTCDSGNPTIYEKIPLSGFHPQAQLSWYRWPPNAAVRQGIATAVALHSSRADAFKERNIKLMYAM